MIARWVRWYAARDLARKQQWAADRPRIGAIERQQRTDRPYGRQPRGF